MKNITITRLENGTRTQFKDTIAEETVLKVNLNGERLTEFSCSGINVNELITGYLYYNGHINEGREITSLDYDVEKETIKLETNTEKPKFANGVFLPEIEHKTEDLFAFMKDFINRSDKFQKTGAVHSSAIADQNGIIKSFDDLSRHNTIFMLLGYSLFNNIVLSDKILLLTCRLTKSILDIILKAKVKMVITKAAPTYYAVQTCRKNDISLAGFVRGKRMNIYHGEENFL